MHQDLQEILITTEQLQTRIREMGQTITQQYAGKTPLFIGVLKGCFIFMADLIRHVDLPCDMDFMAVTSYGGKATSSTGAVKITKDLARHVEGRDVIIVEDILDSGHTLYYLRGYLLHQHPNSLRIVTLLDKPSRREVDLQADYIGFTVPNAFVVGYGLDYDELYRNLPYIGVLRSDLTGTAHTNDAANSGAVQGK